MFLVAEQTGGHFPPSSRRVEPLLWERHAVHANSSVAPSPCGLVLCLHQVRDQVIRFSFSSQALCHYRRPTASLHPPNSGVQDDGQPPPELFGKNSGGLCCRHALPPKLYASPSCTMGAFALSPQADRPEPAMVAPKSCASSELRPEAS